MTMKSNSFSDAELRFIKEFYPSHSTTETTFECNKKFGKNRSYDTIRTKAHRLGLKKDSARKKEVGHTNNKRAREVGEIWADSQGYLHIVTKTLTGMTKWKNGELLHRYVWESAYGKIPNDKYLIFLDGNKKNCDLSNLALIPKSYIALLNKYNLRSSNPYITRTSIRWCDALCSLPDDIRKQLQKKMRGDEL